MIFKLLHIRKEVREFSEDPVGKGIDTGIEALSHILILPLIIVGVVSALFLVAFIVWGHWVFAVLFIIGALFGTVWFLIARFVRRLFRSTSRNIEVRVREKLSE